MSDDLVEHLRDLMSHATPGPYRAHDHNDMARIGNDPADWIGYGWVGRITPSSHPNGAFDAGWLNADRRRNASKEYRERASADVHFVAEALNALPALLDEITRLRSLVGAGDREAPTTAFGAPVRGLLAKIERVPLYANCDCEPPGHDRGCTPKESGYRLRLGDDDMHELLAALSSKQVMDREAVARIIDPYGFKERDMVSYEARQHFRDEAYRKADAIRLLASPAVADGWTRAEAVSVDDEIDRAFISGWNARLDHGDDIDMALHHFLKANITPVCEIAAAPPAKGAGE